MDDELKMPELPWLVAVRGDLCVSLVGILTCLYELLFLLFEDVMIVDDSLWREFTQELPEKLLLVLFPGLLLFLFLFEFFGFSGLFLFLSSEDVTWIGWFKLCRLDHIWLCLIPACRLVFAYSLNLHATLRIAALRVVLFSLLVLDVVS